MRARHARQAHTLAFCILRARPTGLQRTGGHRPAGKGAKPIMKALHPARRLPFVVIIVLILSFIAGTPAVAAGVPIHAQGAPPPPPSPERALAQTTELPEGNSGIQGNLDGDGDTRNDDRIVYFKRYTNTVVAIWCIND